MAKPAPTGNQHGGQWRFRLSRRPLGLPTGQNPSWELVSQTAAILKHTRKVARDNTVHYQWRTLQLLPGTGRPSYAGPQVEVLERADGELLIRYQGETVDFQEGEPRASARWGESTDRSPRSEGPKTTDGLASSHLDREQRKLLAELESSVEKRAKAKSAAGKGKPLRHQLQRKPTSTQQARWVAVQQAKSRGLSLRAIARELGMSRVAAREYAHAERPPPNCSAPRSGPRPRPWSRHRSPQANHGDIFAFQKGDVFAGQQHPTTAIKPPARYIFSPSFTGSNVGSFLPVSFGRSAKNFWARSPLMRLQRPPSSWRLSMWSAPARHLETKWSPDRTCRILR